MDNLEETMARPGWGKRIRALRKSLNLGQQDLAEKLGTAQSSISRWENEHDAPESHQWDRMAALLPGESAFHLRYGFYPIAADSIPDGLREVAADYQNLTAEDRALVDGMIQSLAQKNRS